MSGKFGESVILSIGYEITEIVNFNSGIDKKASEKAGKVNFQYQCHITNFCRLRFKKIAVYFFLRTQNSDITLGAHDLKLQLSLQQQFLMVLHDSILKI